MTEHRGYSLEAFFRKNPRRARLVIAAACIGIAALVVILCLLLAGGGESSSQAEDSEEEILTTWPDSALLEGIPQPGDGTLLSARQTENTVAIFFGDFPSEALAEFLANTGLEFEGTSPYVAYDDGRTIAVEYDAKEGELSITVIKE